MKVTFSEHTYYTEKISESPILLDLGSCRGAFSEHFRNSFPNSTIIIVEPSKINFSQIKIEGERIIKHHAALSSISGNTILFHEDPLSDQNGSVLFNYFKGIPYEVETISLKDLAEKYNKIDLVKMDIEGAEWECLMNVDEETLSRIQQITVEFHDFIDPSLKDKSENVVKRLTNLGFKVEYNPTTYMHGSKYYDSLFYK